MENCLQGYKPMLSNKEPLGLLQIATVNSYQYACDAYTVICKMHNKNNTKDQLYNDAENIVTSLQIVDFA